MNKEILMEEEIQVYKSMAIYWAEVRKRDDQGPLYSEANRVVHKLGIRVLDILEAYIEVVENSKE